MVEEIDLEETEKDQATRDRGILNIHSTFILKHFPEKSRISSTGYTIIMTTYYAYISHAYISYLTAYLKSW